MLHIQLSNRTEGDFEGRKAEETDYDNLYEDDITVTKPDGTLLCVLLKRVQNIGVVHRAWTVLEDLNMMTNNRIVATGEGTKTRNKQKISAEPSNSGIIGFFERSTRYPYCRACAWNLNNPDKWEHLVPMVREVDELLAKHAPEQYKRQADIAAKTHPDFLIPGTHFSTLTINKNFRTAYHRDAGNLPEGISAMSVIRKGKWSGANLVFPEFKIAVKLDSTDVIIFDPHELHGNTRLLKISKDAIRCSVVYYFRDKIQNCLSAKEELAVVQNRQQGETLFKTKLRKK